jgi:hypothetical protein
MNEESQLWPHGGYLWREISLVFQAPLEMLNQVK